MEIYVNFEQISHLRYVCSCDKWSYYEKKLTYNRCVVEIHVQFPAKLVTHNRCVVALNGHLMMRNGPTIGVWLKVMSISGQISHLR